jgi:hypothetical protein
VSRAGKAATTAKRQRAEILELLKRLTPDVIDDLERRSRFVVTPDGWPAGGNGGEVHGSEVSRPTEMAVIARSEQVSADPIGDKIRALFGALAEAAGVLDPADRWLSQLEAYGDRAVVRDSSLAGDCKCCLRAVAGGALDPIRNGYCNSCRSAYLRWSEDHPVGDDPAAHRSEFERERRVKLEPVERPRVIPAGAQCGHSCCSKVVKHEHWKVPAECPACLGVAPAESVLAPRSEAS